MNVTYSCPHCDETTRAELAEATERLRCLHCGRELEIATPLAGNDGPIDRCLICPGRELFIRKDFSQSLGVSIIVAGFVLSSVAWYYYRPIWSFAILGGTALLDFFLYLLVGNVLECYRCHAQYRGVEGLEEHEPFSLETYERHRQQAARLKETAPAGNSAGSASADNSMPTAGNSASSDRSTSVRP